MSLVRDEAYLLTHPGLYRPAGRPLTFEAKTVLCHGTFDLLHLGHIRHLEEARKQGDRLVVSVTADEHVHKGIGRPRFTTQERVEALKALSCVDEVIVSDAPHAVASIQKVRPAVYCKGIDYGDALTVDAALDLEVAAVLEVGGRFYTTTAEKWSSSRLLNEARFAPEVLAYLESARQRGFKGQIEDAFGKADELKIVFVGEDIIDRYEYVEPLGTPSKEFILATVASSSEIFAGGVNAAAAHAEWRGASVVTNGTPIEKTRYVEAGFKRKLFEVYSRTQVEMDQENSIWFLRRLSNAVAESDCVIVMDFGHGLMVGGARAIVEQSKFLAVNTQTNAGNRGFNLIGKYRPHLAVLDLPEARLATGMQHEPVEEVRETLSRISRAKTIVTHGRHGCYCPQHIPAVSTDLVDTMGAGDAFLAVTAPLVAAGLDLEPAAFAGNVAGAVKCSIMGHRRHVKRDELMQNIGALLA